MKIHEILRSKGHDVVTISPQHSALDAIELLVRENIGSLMVVEDGRPVGIVTERDILRLTARSHVKLGDIPVRTVMTKEVITGGLGDELHSVMDVMTENKIRHLPVMDGARLAGIVSIGDVVNACRMTAERENSHLREYIQRG